ncbi:MAG TPA: zinc ribbon domain-containing protein [Thermodesulfobacteriota bacterium]|nr:zinc ribbon domain-containing protein [Thermodesulfobacteriota bacterium]
MKKCPFCAEDIQDAAIKCKHCGEFLDASTPLLQKKRFNGISENPLLCRPQTTRAWKIRLTIEILVLSWILFHTAMESIRTIKEYYELIEGL